MPIQVTKVVTATTELTDDQILAHLADETARRTTDTPFAKGDPVQVADPAIASRYQLLRAFGVVMSVDPVEATAKVLFVNVDGQELPLGMRLDQIEHRTAT